jgi:lipopolysaccharide exporter
MMVGALLGAEAVGGFRALYTLVMPIGAAITAGVALLVPAMAATMATRGPQGLATLIRPLAVQAGLVAAIAAAMIIAWSADVVRLVFGAGYTRFQGLVLPMAVSMVLQAVGLPLGSGLRALRDGRRIFVGQLITTAVSLPAVALLSLTFGLQGAAWSVPLQAAIMTATAAIQYRPAVREHVERKEGVGATVDPHSLA